MAFKVQGPVRVDSKCKARCAWIESARPGARVRVGERCECSLFGVVTMRARGAHRPSSAAPMRHVSDVARTCPGQVHVHRPSSAAPNSWLLAEDSP